MSPVHQYKEFEKKMALKVKKGFLGLFQSFRDFLGRVFRSGKQNFTIMLIPHSEKKIFNFKISVFALLFIGVLSVWVLGLFFWFSTNYAGMDATVKSQKGVQENLQANVELMREETHQLMESFRPFGETLGKALSVIGVENVQEKANPQAKSDLSSFLNLQQISQGTVKEVADLKNLRTYVSSAIGPLDQVGSVLASQKNFLMDIPTLWPLRERGWVTMNFGPNEHPFTGQWYVHQGIDIANRIGTPVVATANGRVARVEYQPLGYGNYVEINHKYGFSTRYAHMVRAYVTKGQDVIRGQVVGGLGATGLATGPHTHYEVHIGTQTVDPALYLNIDTSVLKNVPIPSFTAPEAADGGEAK